MILYIRSLGFSEFDSKDRAESLVEDIIKDPTAKYVFESVNDIVFVEFYKEYGKGFGLVVRGIINEEEEINVHSLIPSTRGAFVIDTHEVDVVKKDERDVYHVFCEELDSGTPISFFLQNLKEYLEVEGDKDVYTDGVRLSAYCVEGTVILPIDKDHMDVLLEEEEDKIRKELLEQARRGDEDAMNTLDDEADEASKILQERLKSEDILSVLEGFFVPVGDNDDIYSILGNIVEVELLTNRQTNEELYRIELSCMTIPFELYISRSDLVGEPTPGMRLKATCWVHGEIVFNYDEANTDI